METSQLRGMKPARLFIYSVEYTWGGFIFIPKEGFPAAGTAAAVLGHKQFPVQMVENT